MEKVGCTSPFEPNKSYICTSPELGEKAYYDYFEEFTFNNISEAYKRCPKSCDYLMVIFSSFSKATSWYDNIGSLTFKFQRFVKVSTSEFSYSELELLAEVGGYFGLFLGISVNQLIILLQKLLDIITFWIPSIAVHSNN